MLFTNKTRVRCFAKDPAVVRFADEYFLYHSIPPANGAKTGYGIGIARSGNLENWSVAGEIPMTQECERNGFCAPGAIVLGGRVHLFYQTYGDWQNEAVCHAVSEDGINFVKDETNPVFKPSGEWCCGRAIDADVCVFRNRLFLYFATRDHEHRVQKLGVATAALDSGFSRGKWREEIPQSILSPELKWEEECIEAPASVVENGRVYLFYGGAYNCKPQQIGCAVSEDGVFFRRLFTQPFLKNGRAGEWNENESGHPFVLRDNDGSVQLFFQGSCDMGMSWSISRTEIRFENGVPKLPQN